jgi:hypothetical protein
MSNVKTILLSLLTRTLPKAQKCSLPLWRTKERWGLEGTETASSKSVDVATRQTPLLPTRD